MVGLNLQKVRFQFNGHMAIAQVVGSPDQIERRTVVGARGDAQHRLRRGDDPDERTIFCHQGITTTQYGATRQEDAELAAQ